MTSVRRRSPSRPRNSAGIRGSSKQSWITACRDELAAASARVRPGPRLGLSPAVSQLGRLVRVPTGQDRPPGRRPDRRRPRRLRQGRSRRPPDRPQRRQHRTSVPPRRSAPALGDAQAPPRRGRPASCSLRARSTPWPPSRRGTPTSTSLPASVPRSPPSPSWPRAPARCSPARTARPARP